MNGDKVGDNILYPHLLAFDCFDVILYFQDFDLSQFFHFLPAYVHTGVGSMNSIKAPVSKGSVVTIVITICVTAVRTTDQVQ